MLQSLELFCWVWSRKSEHKAISVTVSQVEKGSAGRSRSSDRRLPSTCELHYVAWHHFPWFLTNRNAYIRCKGEKLCLNPINWQRRYDVGDRLCGLVVRVPSYRSRGPGSISGASRFSEK
jgi:hypothetical protein